MEGGPVEVIAIVKIKPECIETARPEVEKTIEAVRKEEGCIKYDWYQDVKEPGTFIVLETYKTMEALQAHGSSEHLKALI